MQGFVINSSDICLNFKADCVISKISEKCFEIIIQFICSGILYYKLPFWNGPITFAWACH